MSIRRFCTVRPANILPTLIIGLIFFTLGHFYGYNKGYSVSLSYQKGRGKAPGHEHLPELQPDGEYAKLDRTFLAIVIISAPKNFERRKAARETFLETQRDLYMDVKHYFVLGAEDLDSETSGRVKDEQQVHRDLLILPLHDAFSTLTDKVMGAMVLVDRTLEFKYMLKIDDDSFVNVAKMVEELKEANYKDGLYWGFFDGRAPVIRNPSNKYHESSYSLCDKYIPYALGGGYVLSHDLVHYLAENDVYLKRYKNEDVSVGTWLAAVKVHRIHDIRFDTEFRSRGCRHDHLVSHKQSVQEMRDKQYNLRATGKLCTQEERIRDVYQYDWDKPPSQCCNRDPSL